MRVFVTGGTGLIRSAVVAELLGNGHTVLALARSDASALAAETAGAEPLRGALADPDVLRAGVARTDGVIHLAFANDFSGPEAVATAVAEESAALATLGQELLGSDRPFVTVSGTPSVPGRASTEADPPVTDGPVGGRGRAVTAPWALPPAGEEHGRTPAAHGSPPGHGRVRRSADRHRTPDRSVRLPRRRRTALAGRARARRGSSLPARAGAGGSRHLLARRGRRGRQGAGHRRVIGRRLGLPVESVPAETYGPLGPIFADDQPSSSTHTRRTLGWQPEHPRLLADLENIRP